MDNKLLVTKIEYEQSVYDWVTKLLVKFNGIPSLLIKIDDNVKTSLTPNMLVSEIVDHINKHRETHGK